MTVAGGGNEKEPKTVFDELDMDGVDASGHWQEEQNRLAVLRAEAANPAGDIVRDICCLLCSASLCHVGLAYGEA